MSFNMKGPTLYKEAWAGRKKNGGGFNMKPPAPKKISLLDVATGGVSRLFKKKSAPKKIGALDVLTGGVSRLFKKKGAAKKRSATKDTKYFGENTSWDEVGAVTKHNKSKATESHFGAPHGPKPTKKSVAKISLKNILMPHTLLKKGKK